MVPQRENLRDAGIAALLGGAAALGASLLLPTHAHAQIVGGAAPVITVPGSVTQDLTVEHSVTMPSIGNNYQSNTQVIASMDGWLFGAVNVQDFSQMFPGWVKLPQDSTDYAAKLTSTILATYQSAFNVVQQQAQELDGENFSSNAARAAGEPAVLAELQDNTAALWQIANELQFLRQQMNTLLTIEIVEHDDQLNEKARMGATAAGSPIP